MKMLRKLLLALGMVGVLAACPSPGPGPQPTPTPPPTPPPGQVVEFLPLLLRQAEGQLSRGGIPHLVFGAIPCWDGDELWHGGWTGFDQRFSDYALAKGVNAFHMRLGPYMKETDPRWTTSLSAKCGPYNGDNSALGFCEDFWQLASDEVRYVGERGANVEVDLIDGWQCKHAVWGDQKMPWPAEDVHACGKTLTQTHKDFLKKAVQTFGCFANVIWEDGNEIGQIDGYQPSWSFEMQKEVRALEQEVGCGVVHMFGTNSEHEEVMNSGQIDYIQLHGEFVDSPQYGKWTSNNEHNPPQSPEAERILYCRARAAGQAHWFWRGGMSEDQMEQTLSLMAQGCDGVNIEGCPFPVPNATEISCKNHGAWGSGTRWDCTPKANGRPIRPEGDPFRPACEEKALHGYPTYSIESGSLTLSPHGNPMQFVLNGSGSGKLHCVTGLGDLCNYMVAQ